MGVDDHRDKNALPLHVKNVKPMDLGTLPALCASRGMLEKLNKMLDLLSQPYRDIEAPSLEFPPQARLTAADLKKMFDAKLVEMISLAEVRGCCRVFTVAEWAKHRRRVIKETVDINEKYGRDTLIGTTFLTRRELMQSVHHGVWSITVDFAAFYDQIPLGDLVQPYCCFSHNGQVYKLTRLPMGQRQAVDIAATITEVLLDFNKHGVKADSHIDNVRFTHDDKDLLWAVFQQFVQRCRLAGVTINEDTNDKKLIRHQTEYLGIDFDYAQKRVRVGSKTIEKLRLTTERLQSGEYTVQNYLSHMGLLLYASPILRVHVSRYYYAVKEYSEVSGDLQRCPAILYSRFTVCPSRMKVLMEWTEEVLLNRWRQVTDWQEGSGYEYVLVTDASKEGWGAVLMEEKTGRVQVLSYPWLPRSGPQGGAVAASVELDRRKSTYAEPEAIAMAIRRLFSRDYRGRVLILSDSKSAVAAFEAERSLSYPVNSILANTIPFYNISWRAKWIPGITNVADDPSRGRAAQMLPAEELAARVRAHVSEAEDLR